MSPTTAIQIERERIGRIRSAFAKLLTSNPAKAIEWANGALSEASREEEDRAISATMTT